MSHPSTQAAAAPVPLTDAAALSRTSPLPPEKRSVASGLSGPGGRGLDFRGVLNALGYRAGEYVSVNHQPPGGEFRAVVVSVEEAADQPARWSGENVWWSVNPVRGDVNPGCRGTVEQVTRWVALYVDIDVKTGGMPSWEAAYALIDELSAILGVRPVLVVRTGHGLQPLWLLEPADEDDRALDLTVLERRRAAVGLLARWGRLVGWVAGQHGGAVDTVFDLARVLRVADTVNVKFPDRPVPVTAVLDTGAPLTVGRLVEVLDEYAIPAYVEDAETIGQVVNDPEGWGWASAACVYTAGMIKGWENDPWPARHPKLVAATVRLACARRYGCLTEEEYRRAVKVLTLRMEQLCASQEPVRKVARGEITGALAWGQAKAASLIDERVREELGDHEHRQPLPDWLPEPPTTKPQGCADPAPLPEPDLAQLWARPSLARLRDFARSRRVAPLALLGAALARAVAACPAQYVLPPLVGSEGTLNMAVNLVGSSGVGKGGAHAAARDALDLSGFRDSISGDPELFSMGLGSGEGIAHLYAKYDKSEGGLVPVRGSVLFTCMEIDTLTALGSRQGATLLPKLREAWSGEELSYAYADPSKRLKVPALSYRFSLIAGVQPERAGGLLADTDGGMPQRMLWLPTTDPEAPDQAPATPTPLRVQVPAKPPRRTVIDICPEARQVIDQARLHTIRTGQAASGALDNHALYAREKVAAALALLDGHLGRDGITSEDWHLSGLLMQVSDQTRAQVQAVLAGRQQEVNQARGRAESEREVQKVEAIEAAAGKKAGKAIVRELDKRKPGEWVTGSDLRRALRRHRDFLDEALSRLIDTGQIEAEEVEYHGQHGHRYRRAP